MTMRVFQNTRVYPPYAAKLRRLVASKATFAEKIAVYQGDCYDALHALAPMLSGEDSAFYTLGNNADLQRCWAREKGLAPRTGLEDILLAQIEDHRTEVFYNFDLENFDARFLRRMPGSVRAIVGWQAAPLTAADLTGYLMVCNFPSILENFRGKGLRAAYFAPAHDCRLDSYASNDRRDIDVLFVGGYSQYHARRAATLEAVAGLNANYKVIFSLYRSRLNRLAETPLGLIGPLRRHRRPGGVRAMAQAPVFGRAYYDLLARAKIVFNGAIDMAGWDRGNMRCWETLGARALLVSDEGNYPAGMADGETIRTYRGPEHAIEVIEENLVNAAARQRIADAGYEMIKTCYSKAAQWDDFQRLVAEHF